jgi:hypothetical protein
MMLFFDHNHKVLKTVLGLKTALKCLSVLFCLLLHDHHFLLVGIHHPLDHMEVLALVHHLKVSILFYLFILALAVGDA